MAWDLKLASEVSTYSMSGYTAYGMAFNSSGTKMYLSVSAYIKEYDLSTAWDITTITYNWKQFAMPSSVSASSIILLNDDADMYILVDDASGIKRIHKYTFGTEGDVTTLSYSTTSPSLDGIDINMTSCYIKPDLTAVYVTGNTSDKITKISFNTTGDITSLNTTTFSQIATGYAYAGALWVSVDEESVYIARTIVSKNLYQRKMSTKGDITTLGGTYDTYLGNNIGAIYITSDGNTMYLFDNDSDMLRQISLKDTVPMPGVYPKDKDKFIPYIINS